MEPAVLSGVAPTLVSQLSGSIRRPSQILASALRKTSLDVRSAPAKAESCSARLRLQPAQEPAVRWTYDWLCFSHHNDAALPTVRYVSLISQRIICRHSETLPPCSAAPAPTLLCSQHDPARRVMN